MTLEDEPLFMIGIAARLAGVHPQTLRIYERKNLIFPRRSAGSTRLYSEKDIDRLKMIQRLTQDMGMSLAGVVKFFELDDELVRVRSVVERLERDLDEAQAELRSALERASKRYELVPITKGEVVLRRLIKDVR
ncbi:MAG: MerR family transcriptional regulator [Actinobacteria bacterium]|nr:MerR family transcriptional regulator [Actinomycetota bacterium]